MKNRKTHCVSGHEYTEENIYINWREDRECRICRKKHNRKYHSANREKKCEYGKKWQKDNPEKSREAVRRYLLSHPSYPREYYSITRESRRAYGRRYRQAHPEIGRAKSRRRRALEISQIGIWTNDVSIEQELYTKQDGQCYYCHCPIDLFNRTFHLEHCTPLSRGGKHCITNVVLSCPSCNLKKGSKTEEEFTNAKRCIREKAES